MRANYHQVREKVTPYLLYVQWGIF